MKTLPGVSKNPYDQIVAKEKKVNHARELTEKAAREGVKIILLGELFEVDYDIFYEKNFEHFRLAEPIPGPITNLIGKIAKISHLHYCTNVRKSSTWCLL